MGTRSAWLGLLGLLVGCTAPAGPVGQIKGDPGDTVAMPQRVAMTQERLAQLKLPAGFRISLFAEGLGDPRMMAVADDGTIYVTRPARGDVIALRDADGDHHAESPRTIVDGLPTVHGITLHQGRMYLATPTEVYRADLLEDGTIGELQTIMAGLPTGGQHPKRTMGFGPDGKLYVSVGSTCNACDESDERHATLLRAEPGGSGVTIFAKGLRNTIGFAWHPTTGELWGMDHGSDGRGDDTPPEELNLLKANAHYGWPYCYGDKVVDTFFASEPAGTGKAAFCAQTEAPMVTYQAHAAPIGMAFYTGSQFPAEYRSDAFVAMHGSWNRQQPTGYSVARIRFEGGKPTRTEDFVSGFLLPDGTQFGRPAGVAVAKDGALLVTDDDNGKLYRIAYFGE